MRGVASHSAPLVATWCGREFRGRWNQLPSTLHTMHVSSLANRTDLALLRMAGSEIEDREDHLLVRTPDNPDYWWGNFLLLAQPPSAADAQRWVDRFDAEFPDAEHVAFGVDAPDGTVADLEWFAVRGYSVAAQTVMTAMEVYEPPRGNTSATCRALSTSDDWTQSVELAMRCHAGDMPDTGAYRRFVTAKTHSNRALVESGHGQWFGAFENDWLVSQLGLLDTGDGLARFQSVETDLAHRKRGLAGTLVHHASRHGFDALGAQRLVMVAEPDGPAIELYRRVGYVVTETQLEIEWTP